MTLLQFVLFYSIYLTLSCMCIVGFYIITRGERVTLPDGSNRTTGKILRGWSLYWEEIRSYKSIYYTGANLIDKFNYISLNKVDLIRTTKAIKSGYIELNRVLLSDEMEEVEKFGQCKALMKGNLLYLFEEIPVYVFPEIVRYPLSQCPPCMASVGGTLIYWPIVLLQNDLFSWATYPTFFYCFFWVTFCISLSCLNKLVCNYL